MGLYTVVTDINRGAVGASLADSFHKVSYEDADALIALGERLGFSNTDYVFTAASQFSHKGAALFARHFGIKYLMPKAVDICLDKVKYIDYKDEKRLSRFITDRGKIVPRRVSGACARHQTQIATAIKRARILAILPFTSEHYR